jgi:hypothetical protein
MVAEAILLSIKYTVPGIPQGFKRFVKKPAVAQHLETLLEVSAYHEPDTGKGVRATHFTKPVLYYILSDV